MSDNIIARNKIEIGIDGSGVDAGIAKIDKSIKNLGRSAADSGAQASKGIGSIADGANEASTKIDASTKRIARSIENAIASAKAGSRGTAAFYESIANVRGANLDVLRPYINQLKEVESQSKQVAATNTKVASSFSEIGGIAKFAVGAIAGISLIAVLKDVTVLASRYNELGIVMNVVGRNSGFTSEQLGIQELALRKTGISMLESRSSITKLIAANIDLAKSTELARIAQDAAVIGGVNSSEAFARLVDGIQTAQVETLRTLGLNVNFETSYEKLAATLGKTSASLTEYEKTQARVNAVLALAPTIAGSYEASLDNAGKQLRSSTRYIEDFKVKSGETFNEALTIGVMGFTSSLKDANGQIDDLTASGELKQWGDNIVETMAFVADSVASVGTVFQLTGSHIAEFFAIRSSLNGFFGGQDAIGIRAAAEEDRAQIAKSASAFRDALTERRKALADSQKNKDPALEQMMADNAEFEKYKRQNAESAAQASADAAKLAATKAKQVASQQENILKSIEVIKVENSLISQGLPLQDAKTIAQLKANSATDTMIVSTLAAQKANEKLIETYKFEEDFYASFEKSITSQGEALDSQVASIIASASALEDENASYGKLPSAITDVTIARLEDRKAMLEGLGLVVPEIEAQIQAYQKLKDAQSNKESLDRNKKAEEDRVSAAKKSADEITKAYEKASDEINKSLTDALLRGFESGKGFAQNFKDTLINMFKTLILRPTISAIIDSSGISKIGGAVASSISGVASAGGSSSSVGGSTSLFSTFSNIKSLIGGVQGSLASSIASFGGFVSSLGASGTGTIADGLSSLGSSISLGSSAIADAIPYAGALIQLAQGNVKGAAFTAAGAAIGSIIPGIGTAIGAVIGTVIGSLVGNNSKGHREGASVTGTFSDGEFTNGSVSKGSATYFSANYVNPLQSLSKVFATELGTLLSGFNIDDSITTSAEYKAKQKGGKGNTKASFGASINGISIFDVFDYKQKDSESFTKYVDSVLGSTMIKAIQSSSLTEGIKALFSGLSDKTQVTNMINASLSLNNAQKQLAIRFGLTVDQAAKVSVATSLAGDSLIEYVNKLASSANAFNSAGDVILKAKANLANALGTDIPSSLNEFDLALKNIDKTTQAGIESFVEMFSLRDSFAAFTQTLDSLKGGVKGALYGIVSDTEKQAMLNADLAKAFSDLGISVPASIQDLIALGKSIDYTTKDGLDLAAVFPSLVTAFNQTQTAVGSLMNSLRDVNEFTTLVDFKRYKGLATNYGNSFANNYIDGGNVTAGISNNTSVTTTSSVQPSNNTTISTSDPNLLAAIQALTAQVAALQASADKTAENSKRSADVLVNVSPNGNALQTEAVA